MKKLIDLWIGKSKSRPVTTKVSMAVSFFKHAKSFSPKECTGNVFLACFWSAQNLSIDQFLCRFSNQFAVLPAHFSKKGLQILLLSKTEWSQYNACSFALHRDGLMARTRMRETVEVRGSWSKAAAEI